MKKLFLIFLLICFLAVSAWAMSPVFMQMVAGSASNGALGETTHDTSQSIFGNNIYHDKWTPTTAGKINYIHAYISGGNGDTICLAIYNAAGTELANCSGDPGTDNAGWYNCQLSSEVTLVDATIYYLGIFSSVAGVQTILYQKDAGDGGFHDTNAGFSCGDNINAEESTWYATDDITMIVNNVAGDPS